MIVKRLLDPVEAVKARGSFTGGLNHAKRAEPPSIVSRFPYGHSSGGGRKPPEEPKAEPGSHPPESLDVVESFGDNSSNHSFVVHISHHKHKK